MCSKSKENYAHFYVFHSHVHTLLPLSLTHTHIHLWMLTCTQTSFHDIYMCVCVREMGKAFLFCFYLISVLHLCYIFPSKAVLQTVLPVDLALIYHLSLDKAIAVVTILFVFKAKKECSFLFFLKGKILKLWEEWNFNIFDILKQLQRFLAVFFLYKGDKCVVLY